MTKLRRNLSGLTKCLAASGSQKLSGKKSRLAGEKRTRINDGRGITIKIENGTIDLIRIGRIERMHMTDSMLIRIMIRIMVKITAADITTS